MSLRKIISACSYHNGILVVGFTERIHSIKATPLTFCSDPIKRGIQLPNPLNIAVSDFLAVEIQPKAIVYNNKARKISHVVIITTCITNQFWFKESWENFAHLFGVLQTSLPFAVFKNGILGWLFVFFFLKLSLM